MSSLANLTQERSAKASRALVQPWLVVAAFSLFYFVDVLLRARDKFFWYDEVFTVWFCRIQGAGALWHALQNGVDFNPPFFYWLTEAGQFVFGQGHIGTRITEIFSFWIFCVCLFRFVGRRAGVLAGTLAMLLPVVTQAYYWAYEARPHGLVLGFCGLALLFWQMAMEPPVARPRRRLWLFAFALSLLGAMMMHCFALVLAAPFAIVELHRTWRTRRIDRPLWAALAIPPALSACLYVPLLFSYRKLVQGNTLLEASHSGWTRFQQFYWFLFQPCILVVLAALIIFALDLSVRDVQDREQAAPRSAFLQRESVMRELLLGLCFILVPGFGIALGKLVHAPFFDRYYLSALAGVCIVVGLGAGSRKAAGGAPWAARALTLTLVLAAGINFSRLLVAKAHGQGELLIMPDSREEMETTPGRPLAHHPLLAAMAEASPRIAVLDPYDFIYLVQNAPANLKAKLYFASETTSDFAYGGFARFLEVTPVQFHKPVTIAEWVRNRPDGLLYGKTAKLERLVLAEQAGCRLAYVSSELGHYLATCRPADTNNR